MAAPPPELLDELVGEILLRLPPDEPEHLFRAALVCKPWLRILCDPAFLRRYRAFHGAPPLLAVLHELKVLQGSPPVRFASTTSMPDFPHPATDGRPHFHLDCRHGRALIHMVEDDTVKYLVWDPVTGQRHVFPKPDIDWLIFSAAVFCAVPGCDHLHCHGGPFGVVVMATDDHDELVKASAYSSETGAWSVPVSLGDGCESYVRHRRAAIRSELYYIPYVQPRRGAAIGDEIYFTLRWGNAVLKYELAKNCISLINSPSPNVYGISLMVMEDSSLGFACIKDSTFHLWSRKVNSEEAAEWVLCRVIELEATLPLAKPGEKAIVVGSAEGVGVIFVSTGAGLFTIKLNSGQVRKVDEPGVYFSVLPYMSFYTPDRGKLLSLARAH